MAWIGSLFLIRHHEDDQGWQSAREEIAESSTLVAPRRRPISQVFVLFAIGALATLAAGVVLAFTSEAIATRIQHARRHLRRNDPRGRSPRCQKSPPASMRSGRPGDTSFAMSDIIAGNAFLPVLFLFGTLLSNQPRCRRMRRGPIFISRRSARC